MATRIVTRIGTRPVTSPAKPAAQVSVPAPQNAQVVSRVVTLDNAMLHALLARPDVLRQFPFMQTVATQIKSAARVVSGGGCLPCQKKRHAGAQLDALKATLAAMPRPTQEAFKKAIPAEKVRFNFVNGAGRSQRAEF